MLYFRKIICFGWWGLPKQNHRGSKHLSKFIRNYSTYHIKSCSFFPVHPCDKDTKGGCAQVCNKDGAGFFCSCEEGFKVSTQDEKLCEKGKLLNLKNFLVLKSISVSKEDWILHGYPLFLKKSANITFFLQHLLLLSLLITLLTQGNLSPLCVSGGWNPLKYFVTFPLFDSSMAREITIHR